MLIQRQTLLGISSVKGRLVQKLYQRATIRDFDHGYIGFYAVFCYVLQTWKCLKRLETARFHAANRNVGDIPLFNVYPKRLNHSSLLWLRSPHYTGSSKKMDGIWNRYNLKGTRRIYTFGILKCSEKFKVLDLSQYISICAQFVALETYKRHSICCHVFWIMSRVKVSMVDVILSCRCWIFLIFSAYTMFLMYPQQEKIKWREIWASRWPGYWSPPQEKINWASRWPGYWSPPQEKINWASRWPGYCSNPSNPSIRESLI